MPCQENMNGKTTLQYVTRQKRGKFYISQESAKHSRPAASSSEVPIKESYTRPNPCIGPVPWVSRMRDTCEEGRCICKAASNFEEQPPPRSYSVQDGCGSRISNVGRPLAYHDLLIGPIEDGTAGVASLVADDLRYH